MRRADWCARLCTSTLQSLPAGAADALRSLRGLDTPADPWHTPDLGPAVVAGEIARRYAVGEHPDDIAAWCFRAGLRPPADAATTLVQPVCEWYRMGRLPMPRWWRPDDLVGTLLRWHARWRLAAADLAAVGSELVDRWELAEDDAYEVLVNASSPIVEAPRIFVDRGHDAASRWLHKVAASKNIRTQVQAALARYPAALHDRDDLLAMTRYRETHDAIAMRLQGATGWRDPVVDIAVGRLHAAQETCGAVLVSLGPFERRLLQPEGELESRFARAMEMRRRALAIDGAWGEVNALPDRVDGRWRTTQWLEDYVYHQGGRLMRRSAGPISQWTIVLDDMDASSAVAHWLADPDHLPHVALVPSTTDLATFQLQIDDDPADPLTAELSYDDTPAGLLDLVVLVQTRRVRLDVFALHDAVLVGVGTRTMQLADDDVAVLLERMLPPLDALESNAQASDFVRFGVDRADAWQIVAAIDAAKSPDLLAALDPELIAGMPRVDARRRADFAASRDALLDALAERAARLDAGETVDPDALREARRRYMRTVEQMRAPRGAAAACTRDDRARVNQLVDGLVDDHRAVLTLTLARSPIDGSSRLVGYWVAGAHPRRSVGEVSSPDVSLEQLQAAARLPLQEPSDLDMLIDAAPTLGRDLVAPLLERAVREITIVAISFVHALPLHLWPASDDPRGARLCDVFETIAYAPSLALLHHLARLAVRSAGHIVAVAHGPDLAFVKPEVDVLSILTDGHARVLATATKQALASQAAHAGVLHLACHGTWIIGDYWRSGLELDGADDAQRWLSVAEIQRTLDLRGASLVCLSACDSGVSATDLWRVDDYLGIDGAFLACGARAVVSSLWSVTDAVSLLFTATMYHSIRDGATVAQAFRAATATFANGGYRTVDDRHPVGALLRRAGVDWQREVRALDDMAADLVHPFYWGGFKLNGLTGDTVVALRQATP